MRASAAAFLSLFALASTAAPGRAADLDWSSGGLHTFVQGQTYQLSFVQSAINDFLGYELRVRYSPEVYESLGFTPGELATTYLSLTSPASTGLGDPSLNEVLITAMPSSSIPPADITSDGFNIPAGTAFTLSFKIRADASLEPGAGNVSAAYDLFVGPLVNEEPSFSGSVAFSPTIVAVPEPQTWATLLAGLALIGAAVTRSRRKTPSIAG